MEQGYTKTDGDPACLFLSWQLDHHATICELSMLFAQSDDCGAVDNC
jgi:hypothetical protein